MSFSEWKKVSLGDISKDIAYGYTESASQIAIGPKFLRITDIVSGLNWETVPYCKITDSNLKKYQLEIGDIVIARTGATTGTTEIIKKREIAVFASYLIRYKIDENIAYPFFIGYVLKSSYWKEFVASIVGGSAQPGANAKQFASFDFLLPPMEIQIKIAKILSSLDEKIELNRQTNQTLEILAQTLFKEMCLPKSEKLPDGWSVGKLREVVEIKYGKDHKHLEDGDIPVYGSGGIMRYANKSLYEKESILIPRKGTLSNLFYINKPFWSVDTMFYTKIKEETHVKFLFLLLKSMNLASMNVGSAVPSLTTEILNKLEIILPSEEVLKEFDDLVIPLFKTLELNIEENQTLINLRDSLLPKLMKGEIVL